jgi:hypothetical protein
MPKRRIRKMKKIICKKVYDTENSTLMKKVTYGYYGEENGYEESLYKTEEGLYFLYVNGGKNSKHPKEDVVRMGAEKAKAWLKTNS